jgi:hypothetical protein
MRKRTLSRLRTLAGTLITCSGLGRIASLWFRELNGEAVLALLVGAIYLIIGIGLFGQGRFTLFLAVAAPLASLSLLVHHAAPQLNLAQQTVIIVDAIAVLCSAMVLLHMRKQPARQTG